MEVTDPRTARLTALFEAHYDAVLRYAQRRIDPAAAADVAADVFVVVWRRIDEVPSDPLPWLLVTARYTLANHRRTTNRASSLRLRLHRQRPPDHDPGVTLVDDLSTRQRWEAALAELTDSEQEVLALTVWDGLTAAQAAHVMGCGVSAYVMRLSRARRHLRKLLADGDAPEPARRPRTAMAETTEHATEQTGRST